MMKTFMFPGQGSQVRGMGADLFDAYPALTAKADEILGYSIKQLCVEDPRGELNQTQFTQPALYVVNALAYQRKVDADGRLPDYLAGHSLGEFNALQAAGCFDFETGLQLVRKRGELMSQASGGAMAAILNAGKAEIEAILKDKGLTAIDLANHNSETQSVISGLTKDIASAQNCFTGNMLYYPLNTSGAFHSRYMRPAQEQFEQLLAQFTFSAPSIPVIANVTALPYVDDAIADTLARQISSMVRWSESIQYLMARSEQMEFEEIGVGEVLSKLARAIRAQVAAAKPAQILVPAAAPVTAPAIATARPAARATRADAAQLVRDWNSKYPIGTAVKSSLPGYEQLQTRTEAVTLFGHRAAVYLQGYNGYFDLEELQPA
jgi:malonyl CoA-acyl carrier protein transacylase